MGGTANKRTIKTVLKEVMKNFTQEEIEIANIIMQRMGSWETRNAFSNQIKPLYLYAAKDVLHYIEKTFELTPRR